MTPAFHRFPHTPHLAWLAEGSPRSDKVLPADEATKFLAQELVVEEKIDGANLGLSTDADGTLLAQNRGSWLSADSAHPQFRALWPWLAGRREALVDALWPDLVLFGEWCAAVHSIHYDALPDWFLGFDVFDRASTRFWSTRRRDELLDHLGLKRVPHLGRGRFDIKKLVNFISTSRVGSALMEGAYIREESETWLIRRTKIVRAEFTQTMDTHWSSRPLRRNQLAHAEWH